MALKKGGLGEQSTAPWVTLLCDISKLIFVNVFLFLLPANQEARPETPFVGSPKTQLAGGKGTAGTGRREATDAACIG